MRRAGARSWGAISTRLRIIGYSVAAQTLGEIVAFIYHIELTNACDLTCSYCPLTESTRPRSVMSDETFEKVIAHMKKRSPLNFMILHHFGEPLLHPRLPQFIRRAAEARLNPGFSTNGEKLNRDLFRELIQNGLRWMCIAFHTPAGEAAFHECRDLAREHQLVYWGRHLEGGEQAHDPNAILGYGIERQQLHSFAGTVASEEPRPSGWRPACDYLDRGFVCVLHDGRVVPCAMDEAATNVLGTVDDLDSIQHAPSYELCRSCQGFTFYDSFRGLMKNVVEQQPTRLATDHWMA